MRRADYIRASSQHFWGVVVKKPKDVAEKAEEETTQSPKTEGN